MGRELRRVPLDFDWPIGKVWDGYLNPLGGPCPGEGATCFGGYTAAGKWLESVSRLVSLIAEEGTCGTPEHIAHFRQHGRIYPHPYLREFAQAPTTSPPSEARRRVRAIDDKRERSLAEAKLFRDYPTELLPITREFTAFAEALNGGHKIDQMCGSSTSWRIQKSLVKAAGFDEAWGTCPICDGHADDPAKRAECEAWKETPPPKGDGFQLWETTSEGSPSSPVFSSLDELCAWCADNATTFASFKASADEWKRMLNADLVCHQEGNMVFL